MLAFAGAAAACGARSARLGGRLSGCARAASAAWRARPAGAPPARMMCAGGGGDGTVMAAVERKITAALAPTSLVVTPAYGDPNGSHVSIHVVSDAFDGLNVVKRHRLVYKAIWDELQGPIHAVDELTTRTPAEASG
jgi:stress-induced morphogen